MHAAYLDEPADFSWISPLRAEYSRATARTHNDFSVDIGRLSRNQAQAGVLVRQGGFTARTRAEPGLLGKRFMASGKTSEFRTRAFAVALVAIVGVATCG
jgi:hypothetical protein